MIAINCAYEQTPQEIEDFKQKFGNDFQLFHGPLEPLPEDWQLVETAPPLGDLPLVSYQWWRNSALIERLQLDKGGFRAIIACQRLSYIPNVSQRPDLRTILAPRIYPAPPRTAYTYWQSHIADHSRICLFWKFCRFVDLNHLSNAHSPNPTSEDLAQYTWQMWLINQRMKVVKW